MTPLCLALAVLAVPDATPTPASSVFLWRAQMNEEVATSRAVRDWNARNRLVAGADVSWERGTGLKLGASVQASGDGGTWSARVREVYGRASLGGSADIEAGKRLVRWGTGYGFTPTGVLDPPRDPADPADRLNRREGQALVRVDVFQRGAALTLALAAPRIGRPSPIETPGSRIAARLRGTFSGFDVAAIASAAPDEGPSYGGNVTHVLGQRFEWHAEALAHDAATPWSRFVDGGHARGRTWSAALGFQYTLPVGANIILEYHRDGRGLGDAQWAQVLAMRKGSAVPQTAVPNEWPRRRQSLFARVAPVAGERRLVPELITIVSLDDAGWALVPSLTWNATAHVQAYLRAARLLGPSDSVNARAPSKTSVTAGFSLRL